LVNKYKQLKINGKPYSSDALASLAENMANNVSAPEWEQSLFGFVLEWLSESENLAVKTSGSTGPSKVFNVPKSKMVKSAERTANVFNLKENDITLLCLPVNYIAGKMMVVRAFVTGLDLYIREPAGNPLKNLEKEFEFAAMTPMQVVKVMEEENGSDKLNNIKKLIIGGGQINPDLEKKINKLTNQTYHTYSMTETLTHVAVKNLAGKTAQKIFKALPGVTFEINENDCLVVYDDVLGISRMATNDMVNLISDTEFEFIGRFDNIINSGGIKVFPEILEEKIRKLIPGRFIIGGLPDEVLGEKIVLFIEGKETTDTASLIKKIRHSGMQKHMIPKDIYYVDHFPETENRKIIRQGIISQFTTSN